MLGADVTVIDARDRIGGRVWTMRDGFSEGQHAEAGADMIDEDHDEIRRLCKETGLKLTRILRGGFGYVRPDASGKPRIVSRDASRGWDRLAGCLGDVARPYRLADGRWDSPIAGDIARRSVARWLDDVGADAELRATTSGLRGFFLADPEELSLLALVDEFAQLGSPDGPMPRKMYRIEGGNDRLSAALAATLGNRVRLNTELVAVSHRGKGVRATLKHGRTVSPVSCDYLVLALPATTLRRVPITPALPAPQHEAIARLKYGRATKTLVQFSERFWRVPGRPRAFGSALPFGAVWDGGRGTARPRRDPRAARRGQCERRVAGDRSRATARRGSPTRSTGSDRSAPPCSLPVRSSGSTTRWRAAAMRISIPAFDPALRAWLALPCDHLFFAGEHTSIKWQGYMNGAVESGRRAAAEVAAVHRQG